MAVFADVKKVDFWPILGHLAPTALVKRLNPQREHCDLSINVQHLCDACDHCARLQDVVWSENAFLVRIINNFDTKKGDLGICDDGKDTDVVGWGCSGIEGHGRGASKRLCEHQALGRVLLAMGMDQAMALSRPQNQCDES